MSHFSHQLVLSSWLLNQLGVQHFEELSETLHHKELSGFTEEGNSRFYIRLVEMIPQRKRLIQDEQLRDYDLNIVSHWKQISTQRNHTGKTVYPLYFQWLALLFNELYQDRYWSDRAAFCEELNVYLAEFNKGLKDKKLKLNPYREQELNKLAFWMATGSGKTLLMHVNILQTRHYLKQHNKQREIEQFLLLTPNARLSEQHQKELRDSGISADLYSHNRQPMQGSLGFGIQILHIHQLKDKDGETTVAVGHFEGKNLVLVDEGHRGSSGEEWLDKREKLCEQGFSYEYSATFEQAIAAASKTRPKGDKDTLSPQQYLTQLYAKCILLDYSYRYFYNDGFGKDFHILNLEQNKLEGSQELYLTGCLLAFFQQRLLFKDQAVKIKPYLLDNPLCLFVGGTVTGKELTEQQSDISLIVHFLADFLSEHKRAAFKVYLNELLFAEQQSLLDRQDKPVFHERFSYLVDQYHQQGVDALYQAMRSAIFNTEVGGLLHIEELKGTDGEIGLRVGEGSDYFAVINIGDTGKLCKLLAEERSKAERPNFTVSDKVFAGSLFRDINTPQSRINILIGAKKFTEGWSSWRVSTMGLLNIGKNKGSEIIQLFGRGVRLRGYDFGLQRSGFVLRDDEQQHPQHLYYLETLNIFGIRASYMDEFRQLLEDQGLSEEDEPCKFILKVLPTPDKQGLQTINLKLLRPKKSMPAFKQFARPVFGEVPQDHEIKVVLDWYPRVQSRAGNKQGNQLKLEAQLYRVDLNTARFERDQLAFLDYDQLLFEVLHFKNEKSWHNLQVNREILQKLLQDDWYTLKIPAEFWAFGAKRFERVQLWQEIASVLLKRYCERFYALKKQEYEAPYLEYQTVEATDPNFIREYQVEVPKSETSLISVLKDAQERLKTAKQVEAVANLRGQGDFHFIGADFHLYFPLVELSGTGNVVKVKPIHLNKGEAQFVQDLKQWLSQKPALLDGHEVYLLRNQSKSGVGFFEAGNFYPDFILWLKKDNKQWITFVDPKGLRHVAGLNDRKIRFAQTIKEQQKKYQDRADGHNIVLNSFILSTTPKKEIRWWAEDKTFAEHHVLFQKDDAERYIEKMIEQVLFI